MPQPSDTNAGVDHRRPRGTERRAAARAKTVPSCLFIFWGFFLVVFLGRQCSLRKPITVHPHTPIRRRRTTTSITLRARARALVHEATRTSGQHCHHVDRAAMRFCSTLTGGFFISLFWIDGICHKSRLKQTKLNVCDVRLYLHAWPSNTGCFNSWK